MTAIEQGWANHHGQGSGAPNQANPHQGQGSGAPEPPAVEGLPRFNRRAYIELAFTAPMLRTIRHYIKLNPARRLWKLAHPDRFLCHPNINAQLLKRLPPRYDPSAEDSRELAADRLLILSGFADTPAVPARDIRKHLAASHQFRTNCLAMNDLAAALCGSVGA